MRRGLWIAIDLARDARASGAFVMLSIFLALWLPLQAGMMDGLAARLPALDRIAGSLPVRRSLMMNASWPALAMTGLHAHVFFPRRRSREHEPLLAAPISDLDLALGLSLPMMAVMVLAPFWSLVLNMAGYRLAAGRLPADLPAELARLALCTLAATLVLTAAVLRACFRATTQGGFTARVLAGYAVLAGIDLAAGALSFAGRSWMVPPLLGLACAAAAGAAWLAVCRLDRERLILGQPGR